jgi:hypothetical protein
VKCICSSVGFQTVEIDTKISPGCVSRISGDSETVEESLLNSDSDDNDAFVYAETNVVISDLLPHFHDPTWPMFSANVCRRDSGYEDECSAANGYKTTEDT